MNEKKQELRNIEEKLHTLVEKDKQNWSSFYLLIKKVEIEKLWEESYKSFTAWIKHLAYINKVQESVLWNRKKAGEVYESYRSRKLEQNEDVAEVQNVDIAQDTLILIEKIARNNTELQDELVDKAINKELKKKDLQEAYRIVKSQRDKEKELKFQSELERKIKKLEDAGDTEGVEDIDKNTMTAVDILNGLNNHKWLSDANVSKRSFQDFYKQDKFKVFAEFPVFTGTARKSRRIDALVCENLTTERHNLNLHAVEIKISKSDLLNDHKYVEYAEFVDYLWLAIPESLLEYAVESKLNQCGILIIDENKQIKIVEQAERLNPSMREKCLETLALKLL